MKQWYHTPFTKPTPPMEIFGDDCGDDCGGECFGSDPHFNDKIVSYYLVPKIETINGEICKSFWEVQLGIMHRIDGPAATFDSGHEYWFVDGKDITQEVQIWMEENSLPHWQEWTDNEKLLFRLRF